LLQRNIWDFSHARIAGDLGGFNSICGLAIGRGIAGGSQGFAESLGILAGDPGNWRPFLMIFLIDWDELTPLILMHCKSFI
jgi:hypothetical protein